MELNIVQKIAKLEKKVNTALIRRRILARRRGRKLIPDDYFIEVISTTIPERKEGQMFF
ncbi:MAG: hypothetical protein QM657_09145 [Lacrimispora sp.]|uniref:hypothetical protein n=1 Tax=Lacrimispora sp. TaxID=2719234 RepID=UPI0039E6BB66